MFVIFQNQFEKNTIAISIEFSPLYSLNPRRTFAPSIRQWSEHFTPIWTACGPTDSDPVNHVTHLPVKNTVAIKRAAGDNEIRLGTARIICTAAS